MKLRAPLILATLALFTLAPAEAKKVKTPKSPNANVQKATHKAKKYKPPKYKRQNFSKKPKKSARIKYGTKPVKTKSKS